MLNFQGWLKPPDLGDLEENRRMNLLHPILLVLFPCTLGLEIILILMAPENGLGRWLALLALVAEIVAFLILRSGRVLTAAIGLMSFFWLLVVMAVYLGDGIRGVSILGEMLVIFMAGILVSGPFAVVLAFLTVAANFEIMMLHEAGVMPFPNFPLDVSTAWAVQSVYFLIAVGLTQAYLRSLRRSSKEVERNEQTLRDRVTELRQAQAQLEMSDQNLRRREAILESVAIAAEKLFRGKSFGESVQQVMKDLGLATGVDRVHIFENHRDIKTGDLLASERYEWVAKGAPPQIRDPRYQSMSYKDTGLGRWGKLLASNEVVKVNVKDLPDVERKRIQPQGLLSLLVVPIFVGDDWWGFIGFDEAKWERHWSPAEEDALRGAAGLLGGAFERRRTERALNQSEARYLAILQDLFDLICRYTPEGRATFANEAYCRYFGISQKEVSKHMIWEHVLQPDVEALRAKIESMTPKQPAGISLAHNRRADGEMRWLEWTDRGIFDETGQLIEVQAVGRDIDEEVRLRKQLEENLRTTETQAMTDPLTGLLNRRAIMEHARAEWQRAQREKRPLSLVIMDVDRLKQINDTFGHLSGDEALKALANLMTSSMRRYDWAGRWGGDEFLLVLPGADLDEARNVVERLRLRFSQHRVQLKDQKEIELHVSVGVACQPQVEDGSKGTLETLIARADQALYKAKQEGRDQVGVAE